MERKRRKSAIKDCYLFDLRSGVQIGFPDLYDLKEYLGAESMQNIRQSAKNGSLYRKRYRISLVKFKRKEKDVIYNEYWSKQEDVKVEVWKDTPYGFQVSTLGRLRDDKRNLYPTANKHRVTVLKYNNKLYNIGRVIIETFVRKLELRESVFRPYNKLDLELNTLRIGTVSEQSNTAGRIARKEVALLDKEGNIVEEYMSISEAAELNHITKAGVSNAIIQDRECCGLKFKLLKDLN